MKRSLWMLVTLVTVAVGLIAVARAQRKLWPITDAGAALAEENSGKPPAGLHNPDEGPWADSAATGALQDSGSLVEEQFAPPVGEGFAEDAIPTGPGFDFRQPETVSQADDDQQSSAGRFPQRSDGDAPEDRESGGLVEFPNEAAPSGAQEEAGQNSAIDLGSFEAQAPSDHADHEAGGELLPVPDGDSVVADDIHLDNESSQATDQPQSGMDDGDFPSNVTEAEDAQPADVSPPEPIDESILGTQSPSLTLEKIAPGVVKFGQPYRYEIVVRNIGATPAHSVVVREPIPSSLRLISAAPEPAEEASKLIWDVGTLGPQQERRFSVEVEPTREGEIGSIAEITFSARAASRTIVSQPKIALEVVSNTEKALVGESVTLTFRVSNPGTGAATGVVLVEPIPAQLRHPAGNELEYEIGTLQPGEMREVPLTLTAAEHGRAVNAATVVADGELKAGASATVNIVAPQLGVSVNGPRRRYLGRPATYILAVNNPGEAPATGIQIVSYVPEGMQFVEAANGGRYDAKSGTVSWSLAELPGSESAKVSLSLRPTSPGQMTQRVRATAEQGLEADSELTTDVEGIAAILLEVVDVDDPIEVGADTSYEVRIVSQGSKSSTNVRLVVDTPLGIEILDTNGPTKSNVTRGRVEFEPLAKLGPGADVIYRIRARGMRAGDQRFKVQLTTDQIQTPVREEESTRVYND